jgi:hypothetical protein
MKGKNDTGYCYDEVCQQCGKICETKEEVDVGEDEYELWCYCPDCDIETFHPRKPLEPLKNKICIK